MSSWGSKAVAFWLVSVGFGVVWGWFWMAFGWFGNLLGVALLRPYDNHQDLLQVLKYGGAIAL